MISINSQLSFVNLLVLVSPFHVEILFLLKSMRVQDYDHQDSRDQFAFVNLDIIINT